MKATAWKGEAHSGLCTVQHFTLEYFLHFSAFLAIRKYKWMSLVGLSDCCSIPVVLLHVKCEWAAVHLLWLCRFSKANKRKNAWNDVNTTKQLLQLCVYEHILNMYRYAMSWGGVGRWRGWSGVGSNGTNEREKNFCSMTFCCCCRGANKCE